MAVVWSGICAVAALAAAQRIQASATHRRCDEGAPGHGNPVRGASRRRRNGTGELIVVHEERRPTPRRQRSRSSRCLSPRLAAIRRPARAAREAPRAALRGAGAAGRARLRRVAGAESLHGRFRREDHPDPGRTPQLLTALQVDGVARGWRKIWRGASGLPDERPQPSAARRPTSRAPSCAAADRASRRTLRVSPALIGRAAQGERLAARL